MQIVISNRSQQPIYQQIARQIQDAALLGELEAGTAVPSIRGLAKELRVSVITTKRAYEELEAQGILQSVPGKGYYVAPRSQGLVQEARLKKVEEALEAALDTARAMGVSREQVEELLGILYGDV